MARTADVAADTPAGTEAPEPRRARRLLGSERIRFLIVGGINSAFGFTCFVVGQALFGDDVGYLTVLVVTTIMAVLFAYCGHRWLTFQVRGMWLLDLARFSSVYMVTLALNIVALPLLVEVGGITPILAQSIFVAVIMVLSYLSHRHFSFRRPS